MIGCLRTDQFSTKKPRTVTIQRPQEFLKRFKNSSVAQQITKLLSKNSGQKTFSRSVRNSCAGNSGNVCKAHTVYVGFMMGTPDAKQWETIREAPRSDI